MYSEKDGRGLILMYHCGRNAKDCGGLPTDSLTPLAICPFDRVTLLTGIENDFVRQLASICGSQCSAMAEMSRFLDGMSVIVSMSVMSLSSLKSIGGAHSIKEGNQSTGLNKQELNGLTWRYVADPCLRTALTETISIWAGQTPAMATARPFTALHGSFFSCQSRKGACIADEVSPVSLESLTRNGTTNSPAAPPWRTSSAT